MNYFFPLILIVLIHTFATAQHPEDRYLICENGLWGYIDHTGAVKIPTRYHSAGSFCDGLAPVRSGGYYGYIDPSGKTVIEPLYDFAKPFFSGRAMVYRGSKPYLIDTKGKILFEHTYTDIFNADEKHNRFHVKTASGKYGMIDSSGKLLADTIVIERWEIYRLERNRDHHSHPNEKSVLPGELTCKEISAKGKTVFSYYNDKHELVREYTGYNDPDKNIDHMNDDPPRVSKEMILEEVIADWYYGPQINDNRTDSCIVMSLTQLVWRGNNGRTMRTNTLTIKNVTKDTLLIPVQDNMLLVYMQAKDPNGEWRDIEDISPSGCGNSYYNVCMGPNKEWEFSINNYNGAFPTELRMRMMLRGGKDPIEVFSNTIPGSINPGQFWNPFRIY